MTFVTLGGMYLYLSPQLPPVESLLDVQLQTPLRVYSSDNRLIGEFGEQRRTPVAYEDLPPLYIKALLAAEDDEFYAHSGVSIRGLVRAASQLLQTGQIQSGGSTLTMQLARDFFLSREQIFSRKFNEILLALKIEQTLSKQEIMELFSNKMFFGNRAYGIHAAAQIYYGESLQDLSVEQYAMIVGVLKAPSAYNPLANPRRAMIRRNWILGRMLELDFIDQATWEQAVNTPDTARYHGLTLEVYAPYVAEAARMEMLELYGPAAYTDGYKVYTTIDSRLQLAAQQAVATGLMTYDRRHGYRGPERRLDVPADGDFSAWASELRSIPVFGGLHPAAITQVRERSVDLITAQGEAFELGWDQGISSLRRYINENARGPAPESATDILRRGDVVRLINQDGEWQLSQVPDAQGALVGLDPSNGAIRSIVGGFDFRQSNYNRAIQAARQPGSSFKPFIYASALENGYTPATLVNDAPIVIDDASLEGAWRPENDGGTFLGPTRVREALYRSRNLVSIRMMRAVGMNTMLSSLERFGLDPDDMPRNLSLSLGSYALTPLQMAQGYAVFANGGYRVEPYIIERVEMDEGSIDYIAKPYTVCRDCQATEPTTPPDVIASLSAPLDGDEPGALAEPVDPMFAPPPPAPRVMDEQTAYLMDSMLRDVIQRGTGRRARVLERSDIGGKTGTTNGPRDAWFAGYSPDMVTVAWVGFDRNTSLGRGEYGGVASLPIWIEYMRTALAGVPERPANQPDGIVTVRINPETGMRARPGDTQAVFEIFRREDVPPYHNDGNGGNDGREETLPDELF
ncbi:penicillin-binding protein 1A [Marinimicrobium alkaliphilum]|uniref:penicillin-binding protein 1A n=1 Tax=Marinimicrobium alkaliphilum TaxID=2202654 RepID=UPI002FCCEC6A